MGGSWTAVNIEQAQPEQLTRFSYMILMFKKKINHMTLRMSLIL
jgi:hypothetical protein